jgi:hypothetical protein
VPALPSLPAQWSAIEEFTTHRLAAKEASDISRWRARMLLRRKTDVFGKFANLRLFLHLDDILLQYFGSIYLSPLNPTLEF